MKRIRDIRIEGNFYLGSTITTTVLLDYVPSGADTVTISVEDPTDDLKVDNSAMTKLADGVYQYSHQTAITDDDGEWVITIKAVSGSNTIYGVETVLMETNPLED